MKQLLSVCLLFFLIALITACSPNIENKHGSNTKSLSSNPNQDVDYSHSKLEKIYLAGGCFWGVEAYFARIYGVSNTTSGYANGSGENPEYEEVIKGDQGFVETVLVEYDPQRVSLTELLTYYFKVVDPTSVNRQGNDKGIQYRTGIYYVDEQNASIISALIKQEQKKYDEKIVTEVLPLNNYFLAEEYHQDYLEKNPGGYCHIDLSILDE
ncbi:peptide-methionine (S)-S-oxide reductase MsrA [Bacillus sp. FSL K6-3431]|uniref:peptide-methionine (S)-S-oxide reductase MsrA n=1 Tax=Bacillus sp. FSL K6-3431 TaxID=2921500 RepID=UPI0030F8B870